jgi:single-strand DNA-binding protein
MFQQTIVIGNLGNDPEMKFTANGTPVAHFSVAVNEKYGERASTTWFRVTAWDKLGEVCNQYLAKGRMVMVIGTVSVSLATGNWECDALRLISYAAAIATYEAVIALEKLLDKDEQ